MAWPAAARADGRRPSHQNDPDGTITLTGHVHTWAEHDAVVGAASMAIGVVDVRDDLQVTG